MTDSRNKYLFFLRLCYAIGLRGTAYCWLQAGCYWISGISQSLYMLLLNCVWKSLIPVWLFATPWTIQSREFSRPEYWMGSLSLLQGIFPTQGSNPSVPCCRQILYQLSHKESPRILEWVAYPFSTGSSQPRNQTRVSCITGVFFTNWAIREPTVPPGKPYKNISTFNKIYL